MKHLQEFSIFRSLRVLTRDQRNFLKSCTEGTWSINSEGKIDINGDFLSQGNELVGFKGLEFGEVSGKFFCNNNLLTSLAGSPRKIDGRFTCFRNRLTSLEGGPEEVGGNYDCGRNNLLVSLSGAPKILKGEFEGPGIYIPRGFWSPEGIFDCWENNRDDRGKSLLETIFPTHVGRDFFQKKIDADPSQALSDLKNYFSEPWFRSLDLKWPGKMGPWVNLMGDAGELGF